MSSQANTITHDAAARILKVSPAELTKLVDLGAVPRVGKDAYALLPLIHGYIDHVRALQQRIIERPTQAEIAEHLGVTDRTVRELATKWEVDSRSLTLSQWRERYVHELRETAAGRSGGGGLNLATERARLAKEQADRIAMQNAVTRKELAPAFLIEEVLSKAGARAGKILDTIPGDLKRRLPVLGSDDIAVVTATVAKARNLAARVSLADLDEDDEEERARAAEAQRAEDAAQVLIDGGDA